MASIGRNSKRGGGAGGQGGQAQVAAGAPRRASSRGGPPGSSPGVNAQPTPSGAPAKQAASKVQDHATNGSTFRTDADISHASGPVQRELQPWAAAPVTGGTAPNGAAKDAETFGALAGGTISGAWDQFAVNERLTGATTDFNEELYTTKLNRGAADYRKREKEAERLAKEIMTGVTTNPHIAEERNQVDDSGEDEEDKYSGVIRAPHAYVPPGARKSQIAPGIVQVASPTAPVVNALPNGTPTPLDVLAASLTMGRSNSNAPVGTEKPAVPKVSVEEHDVVDKAKEQPIKAVIGDFKAFVSTERERFEVKKQSMAKTERTRQFAELVKFGQSFKVTHPLPKDILPILTKDEQKQKDIEAKANEAALAKTAKPPSSATSAATSPQQPKKITMKIQEIPAFGGAKRPSVKPAAIPVEGSAAQNVPQPVSSPTPSAAAIAAAKLNPKASAFVFKPSAAAFTPKVSDGQPSAGPSTSTGGSVAAASPAPSAAVPATPAAPLNPFFQGQPIRRTPGLSIRDDFNPWKHNKLGDATSIAPAWPYSGKRFMAMFPPVVAMHPQPGSFEDESMMGPMPPNGGPGFNPGYPYQPYRFGQPGMMHQMPMPGAGPFPPQFPGGMPGPNGPGPMYYNPGMPQGPQYIAGPPANFSPNGPNRPGPGPGPQQMYYAMQSPQLNHAPFSPQQQQQQQHQFQQGPPPTPPQPQAPAG